MLSTTQQAAVGTLVSKGVKFDRALEIVLEIVNGKNMPTDQLIKIAGYSYSNRRFHGRLDRSKHKVH